VRLQRSLVVGLILVGSVGRKRVLMSFVTAQWYAERGHATVSRLSLCCPSVRPFDRDAEVRFSHRLEHFESNFTAE